MAYQPRIHMGQSSILWDTHVPVLNNDPTLGYAKFGAKCIILGKNRSYQELSASYRKRAKMVGIPEIRLLCWLAVYLPL